MKIIKKIKFRIANFINKRYSQSCWANLVTWSTGLTSTKEMFFNGVENAWNNQICPKYNDGAWCGKCEHKCVYVR